MKNKNEIRSNFVKESLDSYSKLAATINENTENAVRKMLDEAVKKAYAGILEDEDKDYDVDEVEDTDVATDDAQSEVTDGVTDGMDSDSEEETVDDVEVDDNGDETEVETDTEVTDEISDDDEGEDDEWSEFGKYEVGDNKYDLSNAEDDEIVKVYKLLKNDDDVVVNKEGDKVEIKDNETGAEYIVTMGADDNAGIADAGIDDGAEFGDDAEEAVDDFASEDEGTDDFENQEDEDMNESRFFEVVLQEYNSNVGYTDNYQKKDVMTNPGMTEPGKNVNDWDKGVPDGTKKPWSGKKNDKSENQPFTAEKGKQIEEEEVVDNASDEAPIEEANLSQSRWNDTHAAHNRVPAANDDAHRREGMQKTSKGAKYRAHGTDGGDNTEMKVESIMKKANKIFKENKELKGALNEFKRILQEAAVTNKNLGQIIKLFSENTTSIDEKKEIIDRFGNNVKTIEESDNLYEAISNELKKREKMNITEAVENPTQQVNETKIYQSKEIMDSLELMNKICKF